MNKLLILGAGGHGRVVADVAQRGKAYDEIAFLDDVEPYNVCDYPCLGKCSDFEKHIDTYEMIVAIGNNAVRRQVTKNLQAKGATLATVIAPDAIIGAGVQIGAGTVVLSGSIVNTGSVIDEGVLLNTSSVLDHDCRVGAFSHIAVGAKLSGSVYIGENTWIDAGVAVKPNVRICDNCKVCVGSAVDCDLTESGIYTGVPARKL